MSAAIHTAFATVGAAFLLGVLGLAADWWANGRIGARRKAPCDLVWWPVVVVVTVLWAACMFVALCLTVLYAVRLFLELASLVMGWPA